MLFKWNIILTIHRFRWAGVLLVLLITSFKLKSQSLETELGLQKDEQGKYIHYEVVENRASGDSLMNRAVTFFSLKKLDVKQSVDGLLKGTGKLIISKTAFVLTHPSGEIRYSWLFETKKGKYRFWLTDFLFIPYQRDRYGNFVPSTTRGIALETNPGKLNSGEWSSCVNETGRQSAALAAEFKEYLSASQKAKPFHEPDRPVSTRSW